MPSSPRTTGHTGDDPLYGASPVQAVARGFARYATFTGRASRSEYGWWLLVVAVALLVVAAVWLAQPGSELGASGVVGLVLGAGTLVPGVAVAVRRLHDVGRSGWHLLIVLIPVIGGLITLVWLLGATAAAYRPPAGDPWTRESSPDALPTQNRPGDLIINQSTIGSPPRPVGTKGMSTGGRVIALSIGAVLVLSVAGWLTAGGGLRTLMGPGSGDVDAGTAAATTGQTEAAPSASASVTTLPSSPASSSPSATPTPTPTRTPTLRDPPSPDGELAEIEDDAEGSGCRPTGSRTGYGDYPAAECRTFTVSQGLRSKEKLSESTILVACQRDLERKNPQLADNQSNTWWMWTQSDAGTWDWFPHTAAAQGESDQPINGIALCEDAS